MILEAYEIVKEFEFHFDGFDNKVKAKIKKRIFPADDKNYTWKYTWDVNYIFPPPTGGYESYTNSIEQAEEFLMTHLKYFNGDVAIPNESF